MTPKINNLLKLFTIAILIFLALYRFRIRVPRDIFLYPTMYIFIIYILIFCINIIIFFITFLDYSGHGIQVNKTSYISQFSSKIKLWLDDSYAKFIDIIINLPEKVNIILAYITHYYIKIPFIILKMLKYVPKILFMEALSYDVFVIEKFQYSYYILFLLLISLISRTILNFSIRLDEQLLQEAKASIMFINPEYSFRKHYETPDIPIKDDEYCLSEYNRSFKNITEALQTHHYINTELKLLQFYASKLESSLKFLLLIRLCYIIIFGYIIYNYPIILF